MFNSSASYYRSCNYLKTIKSSFQKKQNFVKIEVSCNPMFYGKLYSQVDKLYYWNDPIYSKLFEATQQLFLKFQMQGTVL